MQQKSVVLGEQTPSPLASKILTLQDRSDELLISIATLGLLATIADGEADPSEVETFSREFNRSFALKQRQSLKIIGEALARVRGAKGADIIESTCNVLNEYLDMSHKVKVFEELTAVLVADGKVHEGEEYFLDCVARELKIEGELQGRFMEG